MNITILGSGRWASTIAWLCAQNGNKLLIWERKFVERPESEFFKTKRNEYVDLIDADLEFTHDLGRALNFGEYVIISILSQNVNELMQEVKRIPDYENKKYVLAMKGVEQNTGRTLSEILRDNGVHKQNICVIAGPGHPQSIVKGKNTHMVVAGYDSALANRLIGALNNPNYTLYPMHDVKGVELCGAAKNVYGGLAGMCVGSNNDTLRGSLMCASLAEMESYLEAMQCMPKTARRLPLLGDYDATMYDLNSHNLNYGIEIVKQNTNDPKLPFVSIEGRQAVSGLLERMKRYNNQVSDTMQLQAHLLETYKAIIDGTITPANAIIAIKQAIGKVYASDNLYNKY